MAPGKMVEALQGQALLCHRLDGVNRAERGCMKTELASKAWECNVELTPNPKTESE